jgi:anaerobic selenocysteine-containing dehydrogenase
VADGLADVGDHVRPHVNGLDEAMEAVATFTPNPWRPRPACPPTPSVVARELAAAPTAAVYGRIGTTTTLFGTTTSWLVDVVNALTGNLDRPGGVMFTLPVAGGSTTRGTPGGDRGFRSAAVTPG